ncbi:ribonuclease YeeF family protein [Halalkalibacterium halodurans]|uniref:ribonuclease YeeF family protein n=1 Tax=Halalkalibacterium halodurans TaxID=86665 RepID=UPI002AA9C0AE|nr:ribonuclease YeeF family protein [Halalkalibacterium halodurans]MDY7224533.1 ribonuclease YeeF family protein [Halalkalibacterium halodurans]MDY7243818.1 ribonuclease YeeF family protein [Halalkalibacterium halodurans]
MTKHLDVAQCLQIIDGTNTALKSYMDHFDLMEAAISRVLEIEGSLKGKGGEALLRNYQELQLPAIRAGRALISSMMDNGEKLQSLILSFEPSENGMVSEDYYDRLVPRGYDRFENFMEQNKSEIDSIAASVSHIIDLGKLDISHVQDQVDEARKHAKDTVEGLYELDHEGMTLMRELQREMNELKAILKQVIEWTTNGGPLLNGVNIQDVRSYFQDMTLHTKASEIDLETLDAHALRDFLQDGALIKPIVQKFAAGEALTYTERELLYFFLQHIFLGAEKRKEIESIAEKISEDRIDELVYRLNHTVLTTESTLDDEIALIQAYLFSGNHQTEMQLSLEEEIPLKKLRAYSALLDNYKIAFGESKRLHGTSNVWARVEWISYIHNSEPKPETYTLQTAIQMTPIVNEYSPQTREEFLARKAHQLDGWADVSKVTYFAGRNIASQLGKIEEEKLQDKYNNYTFDFFKKEVVNVQSPIKSTSALGKVIGIVDLGRKYHKGKEDLERRLSKSQIEGISDRLNAEFLVVERPKRYNINHFEAEVFPTVDTYNLVNRWKEVYSINPNIPFPEQAMTQQDWYEISEFYSKKFDEDSDLYNYIRRGSKRDSQTVKEIANGN